MGNRHGSVSSSPYQYGKVSPSNLNVRQFHEVHSDNIGLLDGGRVAKRLTSFCKGICFSKIPYQAGDLVTIRVHEVSTSWSGFLRIGFTSHDPFSVHAPSLPKYACPDLTNQPGNWAKSLPEGYCQQGVIIAYYFDRQGDVYISANGEDPVLFFSGVSGNERLWALIDIYGNATAIKLLNEQHENIHPRASRTLSLSKSPENSLVIECPDTAPIKYYTNLPFTQLPFHNKCGRNVMISSDRTIAFRLENEYSNAYVFTNRPLQINEIILIQILKLDVAYSGGLTLGMTACDPASVSLNDLPDDADILLDRLEYWVVHKDVVNRCEVGDELFFHFTEEGELKFGKNGRSLSVLMHVDKSVPMWLFFDLYGQFCKIKLAGSCNSSASHHAPPRPPMSRPPMSRPPIHAAQSPTTSHDGLFVEIPGSSAGASGVPPIPPRPSSYPRLSSSSVDTAASGAVGGTEEEDEQRECIVCMERACDTVIYKCGHQCLCTNCADDVKKNDPNCPICRKPIEDIIKVFKT